MTKSEERLRNILLIYKHNVLKKFNKQELVTVEEENQALSDIYKEGFIHRSQVRVDEEKVAVIILQTSLSHPIPVSPKQISHALATSNILKVEVEK